MSRRVATKIWSSCSLSLMWKPTGKILVYSAAVLYASSCMTRKATLICERSWILSLLFVKTNGMDRAEQTVLKHLPALSSSSGRRKPSTARASPPGGSDNVLTQLQQLETELRLQT